MIVGSIVTINGTKAKVIEVLHPHCLLLFDNGSKFCWNYLGIKEKDIQAPNEENTDTQVRPGIDRGNPEGRKRTEPTVQQYGRNYSLFES